MLIALNSISDMYSLLASVIDKAKEATGEISTNVQNTFSLNHVDTWIEKGLMALVTLIIFVPLLRLAVMLAHRVLKSRMTPQGAVFVTRWLWRIGLVLIFLTVLKQIGLDLVAIMGAAGIAGIAIGFAAQNSLSNVISGLFLMGERSINIEDSIEVNGLSGNVESIGLLSVTLRTPDNRQVRIPNETLLKGSMINNNRYPIRRFDFSVGVSYNEDLDKVIRVIRKVLLMNTYCLDDPDPWVAFSGFGGSSCDFNIGAWCRREDFDNLKNTVSKELKDAFDREGIEIPFPYTTLTGGKAAVPFEVKVVGENKNAPEEDK